MRFMLADSLQVSTPDRFNRRLVVATAGATEHSDRFDLDDAYRRDQFLTRALDLLGCDGSHRDALTEIMWAEAVRVDAQEGHGRHGAAVVRRLAEVPSRPIDWLWPGRAAIGKLTLLAGDPGLGKSFVSLDLAARVSTGRPLPSAVEASEGRELSDDDSSDGRDGSGADSSGPSDASPLVPGDVLLVNCEDDLADTVVPRLSAAGADLSRISLLESVRYGSPQDQREESFSLVDHLAALEDTLSRLERPRLLVIDPISAFLRGIDTHRNADVRAVLAPLAALAARRSVAVIAVTHLSKNTQGPAVHRAMGSLAFAAAARAVWMIVRDPDDSARRLLLPAKNNLGPDAAGLAYRLQLPEDGHVQRCATAQPVVHWESGAVGLTADELAERREAPAAPSSLRVRAQQWLATALDHRPQPVNDVYRQGRVLGYGRDVLRAALADLGGVSYRGPSGAFLWHLAPQHRAESADSPQTRPVRQVGAARDDADEQTDEQAADEVERLLERAQYEG